MRVRDSLTLLEDYLTHRDSQVRRNAVAALAVIGTDASVERLVALALGDHEEVVQNHAVRELAALPHPQAETLRRMVAAMRNANQSVDERTRYNILLNRLLLNGWELDQSNQSLRQRLSDALSLRRLPAVKHVTGIGATAMRGLGGALLAALVMCGYLVVSLDADRWERFWLVLFLVSSIAGATLGVFATRWSVPTNLHYDHRPSALAEVGTVFVFVFGISVLIAAMVLLLTPLAIGFFDSAWVALGAAVSVAASAAAVRLGTIVAFGAWATRSAGGTVQLLTGSSFGLLMAAALLAVARSRLDLVEDGSAPTMLLAAEAVWLFGVPAACGLALPFTAIDRHSPPRRRSGLTSARIVSFVAVLAAVLLASNSIVEAIDARQSGSLMRGTAEPQRSMFAVPGSSWSTRVAIPFAQRVEIQEINEERQDALGPLRFRLAGFLPSGSTDGSPDCEGELTALAYFGPPLGSTVISEQLGWGCYEISAAREHTEARTPGFGESIRLVLSARSRSSRTSVLGASHQVALVLNDEGVQPLDAQSLSGPFEGSLAVSATSEVLVTVTSMATLTAELTEASTPIGLDDSDSDERDGRARVMLEIVQKNPGVAGAERPAVDLMTRRKVDAAPRAEAQLEAATYAVRVARNGTGSGGNDGRLYTLHLRSVPGVVASGGVSISSLPSSVLLRVENTRYVRIEPETEDFSDIEFELSNHERILGTYDEPELIETELPAGLYLVTVRPYRGSSNPNRRTSWSGELRVVMADMPIDLREVPSPLAAPPGRVGRASWRIPAALGPNRSWTRRFEVAFPQRVRASVTTDEDVDFVMEILKDGVVVVEGDDPPEVQSDLPVGTYEVRVRPYSEEERGVGNADVSLTLNANADR